MAEGIPLRAARRGDVPSLLLLWTAMMQENGRLDERLAMHPHAREHMAERLPAWMADRDRILVVAEEDGRLLVGWAAARIGPGTGWHKPTRVGEITDCYVVGPRRRQGVARRLVGRLTDALYERGASTIRLQVAAANEGALAFWRSMGWEILEDVLERPVEELPPDDATDPPGGPEGDALSGPRPSAPEA